MASTLPFTFSEDTFDSQSKICLLYLSEGHYYLKFFWIEEQKKSM